MADKVDVGKVRKLLGELRELHDKAQAIHDEIDRLLGGGVGIGPQLKVAYVKWIELHATRYPGQYVFVYQKDAPQMKRLILALGLDELLLRMGNYIRDSDPYLTKARHPFGLFVVGVNRYAQAGPVGELELAAESELESDAAKTAARARANRGSHSGPVGDVL